MEVIATVPLAILLGHSDDPGHLTGHGPIAADQLRAMLHDLRLNAVWRCAALDDDHHTLLGLGTKTYTPNYTLGARLRRLTNHLYQDRCAFPTCTTQATHCDWDHTTPPPVRTNLQLQRHPPAPTLPPPQDHRPHQRPHRPTRLRRPRHGRGPTPTRPLIWTTATGQRHLQRPPALTPLTHGQLHAHATATSTLDDAPF